MDERRPGRTRAEGPARVEGLAAWVAGQAGWRRRALTIGFGALAAIALPPLNALPLLVPAFVGLLWLLDGVGPATAGRRRRAAFATGWWFGFGFFALGLHWVAFAFLVDAARFAWMIPFAVFGLAAGLALFTGLVTLATDMSGRRGIARVLVLALAWIIAEWLRGWILTGFPWNPIGLAWGVSDAMIQLAAVTGVWGLSLLAVGMAAMPALYGGGICGGRRPGLAVAVAALVVAAIWGGGAARLASASDAVVPDVRLRLVQPNIPQAEKWLPDRRLPNLRRQVGMSRGPAAGMAPTHVIWAETAATFFVVRDEPGRRLLAGAAPPGGLLLTGALRNEENAARPRVWNSLHAVDGEANIVATYDKFHLVPFGEYVPLRGILPIEKITPGRSDFSAGPGARTLNIPGLPPVSPLICYEAIFPGHVVDAAARPAWLLNITNDAWFGQSIGPHQHFAAARLRAVEEGLPLVRVANTGISAIVDGYGRVLQTLTLGQAGVLDGPLPAATMMTPFARWGEGVLFALVLVIGLTSSIGRRFVAGR